MYEGGLYWRFKHSYMELHLITSIYYIKASGIPSGNKLIKMIRYPHMWKYAIVTCEDINDFTDIKFVSVLYLNLLVYHQNIFGSSSKVFGNLWISSENLGCFQENVRECSLMPSEQFWKIFGKSSKTQSSLCLYNKKNFTR